MCLSCRYCYPADYLWMDVNEPVSSSFVGMLLYGKSDTVLSLVEKVENMRVPMTELCVW